MYVTHVLCYDNQAVRSRTDFMVCLFCKKPVGKPLRFLLLFVGHQLVKVLMTYKQTYLTKTYDISIAYFFLILQQGKSLKQANFAHFEIGSVLKVMLLIESRFLCKVS